MSHRGRSDPSVHDLHRPPDRLESNPQPCQLISNRLVNDKRFCDLPCRLQSAETPSHPLVTIGSQDAMAQLGKGYDTDSNLIWEITERPLLLTRNEDRRVKYRLHAGS